MSSISPDKLVSEFLDKTVESSHYDQRPTKKIKIEAISTIGDFILSNQINISELSSETRYRLTRSVFKEISNDPKPSKPQKLVHSILLKDNLLKKMTIEDLVFALQNGDFELLDGAIANQLPENELLISCLLNKAILGNHEQAIEHLYKFLKRENLEYLIFEPDALPAIFLPGNSQAIFKFIQSMGEETRLNFWGKQISQDAFSITLFSGDEQSIKMFYGLCPQEHRNFLFELEGTELLSTALSNERATSFFLEHCPKENLTNFYNACIEKDESPLIDFFEFSCKLANSHYKEFQHPKFEFDPLCSIRTLYKMFPEDHKEAFFKSKDWSNPLHVAIRFQRADIVRLIIALSREAQTESIWLEDPLKVTPFNYATSRTNVNVEVLKALLENCPESQIEKQWAKNHFGATPFHNAASNGNVDVLQILLDHCPKSQIENIWSKAYLGHAPFHRATQEGHVDAMLFLLEKVPADEMANQWSKDDDGQSLLHLAVEGGKGFDLILEKYPYPDKGLWDVDNSGCTLLHKAAFFENGSDLIDDIITHCPLEKKDTLWDQNEAGRTPLHFAVHEDREAVALKLLKGVSSEKLNEVLIQKTNDGETAMYLAVNKGNLGIVQALVEFCSEDKKSPLWTSTTFHSILHAAIRQNEQFFQAILELYPKNEEDKFWITNEQGRTVLHEAFKMGFSIQLFQTLLNKCPKHLREFLWNSQFVLYDIAVGKSKDFDFEGAYDFIMKECPVSEISAFFDEESFAENALFRAVNEKSKEAIKFIFKFSSYDKKKSMWNWRGRNNTNIFHGIVDNDVLHLLLENLPEEKIDLLSEKSEYISAPIDLFDDQALEILLNKNNPHIDVLVAGTLEGKILKKEIFNKCIGKFLASPETYSPYFLKSPSIFIFLIENHLSFLVKELVKSKNIYPFNKEELFVLLPALLSSKLRPVVDQLAQGNQNAFESLYEDPSIVVKGLDDVEVLRIYCKYLPDNKSELLREKDRNGQTVLHTVFSQNKIDVIKFLKEIFPKEFNKLLFITDNNGKSPIDLSNKEALGAFLEFSKDPLLDVRIVDYSFENSIHSELRNELIAKFISSPELYFEHLLKFPRILTYLLKNEEAYFKAEIEKRGGLNKLSLEQKNLILPFLKPHEIQKMVRGLTNIEKKQLIIDEKVEEKNPILAFSSLAAQSSPGLEIFIPSLDNAQLSALIPFVPKEILFPIIEKTTAPIKKSYLVQRMPLDLKKELVKTISLFSELLPQYIEQAKILLEKVINDPKHEIERPLMSLRSKVSALNIKKMEFDKLKAAFESGEFDEELKQAVQEARNQELELNKTLKAHLTSLDEIAEQQSNAPLPEFIDPHTGKVMEHPVILPLSGNRVDRETYFNFTARIENGESMHFNPYAQKYVLDKELKDDLELAKKIQEWRDTQS